MPHGTAAVAEEERQEAGEPPGIHHIIVHYIIS